MYESEFVHDIIENEEIPDDEDDSNGIKENKYFSLTQVMALYISLSIFLLSRVVIMKYDCVSIQMRTIGAMIILMRRVLLIPQTLNSTMMKITETDKHSMV